jgi:mRNA-degrading endonuclease toxin of MazEF toxin-antitoxin module
MELKPGDIYYAQLSLDFDNSNEKERPVVILSNSIGLNTVIVAPISSLIPQREDPKSYIYTNLEYYGLKRESIIMIKQLSAISKDRLKVKVGRLSDDDLKSLKEALVGIFSDMAAAAHRPKEQDQGYLKVYKDLKIIGEEKELNDLGEYLKDIDSLTWTREEKQNFPNFLTFRKKGKNSALLFLSLSSEQFEVTNIIPTEKSSLTYDEYNELIDEFFRSFIEPYIQKHDSVSVLSSSSKVTIDAYLKDGVANKLKIFSAAANKSTGSAHPLDKKRWFDFIVASFKEKDPIDSGILYRWFVEVEKWPGDTASQLVAEYENSMDLLDFFEKSV